MYEAVDLYNFHTFDKQMNLKSFCMANNRFTHLISPYLNYIDSGSLFSQSFAWLYGIIAILNILLPLFTLYQAISSNVLKLLEGRYLFILVFIWIVIFIAGILSFQLWWKRKNEISKCLKKGGHFVATPVLAHLLQTIGEWAGTWIGTAGFVIAAILTVGFGDEAESISESIGTGFLGTGVVAVITLPLCGLLIIVITRFLAEQFRALTMIANSAIKEGDIDKDAADI
jgi:hypothetical protein